MDETPKPRRRWLRFSLRTFLIFVAALAIWLGFEKSRALRQERTAATVRELGGNVFLGYRFDSSGKPKEFSKRKVPAWLTRTIGEDYFVTIVTVNFDNEFGKRPADRTKAQGSLVADEDLALLRHVPDVRELLLASNHQLTDDGLAHISGLRHLRVLTLSQTNVHGTGLVHARYLKNLEGLSLNDTPLTDEGLVHLKDLANLEWLLLDGTEITDEGLVFLGSLKSLRTLALGNTRITDEGLKHLRRLAGLKRLGLSGTNVTEAGCDELRRWLPNCKITGP